MTVCAYCGREFEATSDSENLCPQCAAEMTQPEPPPARPSRLRLFIQSPTLVIIAINVLVYVVMVIQSRTFEFKSGDLLLQWGANAGPLTTSGQWWRLLTSTFVHGGILHIALNMWCLFNLGWLAELLFGRARFTLLYLLCGIGGSLGSICWHSDALSVGASGAIFGIAGALIPAMMLHSNPQLRAALKGQLASIGLFVIYNLAFGAALSGTDNAAHIGGLFTGLVLGGIFPTGSARAGRMGRLRVIGGTAVVLALFGGAANFARERNEPNIELTRASDAHERGDDAAAIQHAQRSVEMQPENPHAQFMLGTLLLVQRQYAQAVEPFRAVTRIRSDYGPAYINLCAAQREVQQLEDALANCEKGAQLSPNQSQAWFNLARVRYDLHNLAGAREAMGKAVQLDPQSFDTNLLYAMMLIESDQPGQAVPYLQKAHDLRPQDEGVNRMLTQLRSR